MRTAIKFKKKGDKYRIVDIENAMTTIELMGLLGPEKNEEYFSGKTYFKLLRENTIRCYQEKPYLYKDYSVNGTYTKEEWDFFINWLKEAGSRLSELLDKTETIYI